MAVVGQMPAETVNVYNPKSSVCPCGYRTVICLKMRLRTAFCFTAMFKNDVKF